MSLSICRLDDTSIPFIFCVQLMQPQWRTSGGIICGDNCIKHQLATCHLSLFSPTKTMVELDD